MEAVACFNKNDAERSASSSGGVFVLIARHVLKKGGSVYGAAFTDSFDVEYIRVLDENEIKRLQKSKYVFASVGKAFSECKNDLDSGKNVVFVGTPCHIYALKHYLNKQYDNLICVDFICHGTPEKQIWKDYLLEISEGRCVISVDFRDKVSGWDDYSVTIHYSDGSKYSKSHREDLFMRAFLDNTILRQACYSCKFKGIDNRVSDFTLGDLWGISQLAPELDDDKGVSVVFINSSKGNNLFNQIKEDLVYKNVDPDSVVKNNKSAIEISKRGILYEKVHSRYRKKGSLLKTLKLYYSPAIPNKIVIHIYKHMLFTMEKTKIVLKRTKPNK